MKSPVASSSICRRSIWGLNFPIEDFQSFSFSESSLTDTALDGAIAAGSGLLTEEQIEELEMRQRLFIGAFEDSVEIVGRNRYSQDLKMAQAPVTKSSRVAIFH